MRKYIYKKRYTDITNYQIERWITNDGMNYNFDIIVTINDADYNATGDSEIIKYVFPNFTELKKAKIQELKGQAMLAIQNSTFSKTGSVLDGEPFDQNYQLFVSLGISGFTTDFKTQLNTLITNNLGKINNLKTTIKNMVWDDKATDIEKQKLIDDLNKISI